MQRNNRGARKINKLAHYKKLNYLHSRRLVELVQCSDSFTLRVNCSFNADGCLVSHCLLTCPHHQLWLGGFLILHFCITVLNRVVSLAEQRKKSFLPWKPSRVSLCRIYFNFLFLFVPSFTVRYVGLSSHLPALLGDCVSLLCIQLVSICSSGQNKNINQFIWEKEKMKKIYKTPQKSNINTKCDNSVLPWFITWKARSFEPPKNKPKTFGPEEPASVIEFSVERIPQAPCDGSAEPLGNWLSNKGGKSAF